MCFMLHKLELILRYSIADVDGFSTCSFHASALRTPPLVQKRACLNKFVFEAHLTLAFPNLWEQISDQCLKPCHIATSSSVHRDIHRSDPTATQYHHSLPSPSQRQFEWSIEKSSDFFEGGRGKAEPVACSALIASEPGHAWYLHVHFAASVTLALGSTEEYICRSRWARNSGCISFRCTIICVDARFFMSLAY